MIRPNSWKPHEDEIIKQMYETQMQADIMALLPGRRWGGVSNRARALGLHRPKNYETVLRVRQETTQKCTCCKKIKPLNEFGKCSRNTRGVQATCKECRREYRKSEQGQRVKKEYQQRNIERIRELDKARYYRDKEKRMELNCKLRKIRGRREEVNKRRAKMRNLPRNYTKEAWNNCLEYFNYSCAYCGATESLEQDHYKPLSKGGEYTINNIVPACHNCNSSKNNHNVYKWYPKQPFFKKARLKKIETYLSIAGQVQQLKIL